jgi:Poly(ADP-ribose) polymerase and DNA-Ligase Zn-finger region
MAHVIEAAPTGRAKCRGCGANVAAQELRFGERLPNPFADGETTQWFHLDCAAFKRPEPFLEALGAREEPLDDRERLEMEAKRGVAHRRLPRIDGAERAPSSRARCRACREPIAKDAWRIRLVFYEEDRFVPAGSVHTGCCAAYFETTDVLPRLRRFSPGLSEDDLKEIEPHLADAREGRSVPAEGD